VQALLLQKPGHLVGDFEIVQVREGKVRIATNAYFGQMHEGDIATSPDARSLEFLTPLSDPLLPAKTEL